MTCYTITKPSSITSFDAETLKKLKESLTIEKVVIKIYYNPSDYNLLFFDYDVINIDENGNDIFTNSFGAISGAQLIEKNQIPQGALCIEYNDGSLTILTTEDLTKGRNNETS